MSKAKTVGIGIGIFVIIVGIFGGLLYYSYTHVGVSLNDVRYHSIDWANISFSKLLKFGLDALSGNWFAAVFDFIDGINLNLVFGFSNNGFLPVYIPDLSYDLLLNGVSMGSGNTSIDATIYPGQTKEITALQNFKKASLLPAVSSIVQNDGILEIRVKGVAHFKLFGLDIPVPFESSKTVSVYDEIKNKIQSLISQNKKEGTRMTLNVSEYSVYDGDSVYINGRVTLDDGRGLQNALVYIKDEDTGSGDDEMVTLYTDSSGYYSANWQARTMDPFDSVVEIYAVFEGSSNYGHARSIQINVRVN